MRLPVQRLSAVQRTILIKLNTDDGPIEFSVTYRLSSMNIHLSDWLRDHNDDRGSLLAWLEKILVRWDLEDNDGSMVPTTSEAMEKYGIGTTVLRLILNSCYDDAAPENLKKESASVFSELVPLMNGKSS